MAASTIPNSGGPGSSIELSPVTVAVRDKVIEKFVDQPLDEMNESVKRLLSNEQDEQKRLGILAARVYILRHRISKLAEDDQGRVIGSASPKANDLVMATSKDDNAETGTGEWTRLRILDDCEVNGVRFPKTVIIDVKSDDAERLIASGNAELVYEAPASEETDDATSDVTEMAEAPDAGEAADTSGDATEDSEDELSALSAAMETAPEPVMTVEEAPEPIAEAQDADQEATGEAVIDAPSAAEVTAALEALSGGDNDAEPADADPVPVAAETPADLSAIADNADDAADVAAELEALSAALAPEEEISADAGDPDTAASDAADVAAELEAAAAAMAAGPSNPDTADLPPAGSEDDNDGKDNADKPAGWFEAQQSAEQSKLGGEKSNDDDS